MKVRLGKEAQTDDPIEALQLAIKTFGAGKEDVWIRIRLRLKEEPPFWVVGTLHHLKSEQGPVASPFSDSRALWLKDVVECNPATGEFRVPPRASGPTGTKPKPPLRANALAVRWNDIHMIEIVNSDIVNSGT